MQQSPSFSSHGAVDLGALASRQSAPATGAGGDVRSVVEVTEATFQREVVDRSMQVPVVIDFWATWCGPCKQLSPVLERLAGEYAGRWVLAKIDVDANQRIAAAAGVQSIPTVVAVVKGQVVPMFMGALPEAQVRQYLDELLRIAAEQGLAGAVAEADPGQSAPEVDARYADAVGAIDRGDLDAAADAYRTLLDQSPNDEVARVGLAQVELLQRTRGTDPAAVRKAAADHPTDVDAQCLAADVDLVGGHVEDAFARLVETVAATAGTARDTARRHLLELFDAVGTDDPRVVAARQALARVLF